MTKRFWLYLIVAFLSYSTFSPPLALAESLHFPDRKSFSRLHDVSVEILSYENMNAVELTSTDIQTYVIKRLSKARVSVSNGSRFTADNKLHEKLKVVPPESPAILGIRLRRTEDSALFGAAKIGNVAVTLQLYQRVTIKLNNHSTQAITWSESQTISGGSKRPQKILDALDKLLDMFVIDFLAARSSEK